MDDSEPTERRFDAIDEALVAAILMDQFFGLDDDRPIHPDLAHHVAKTLLDALQKADKPQALCEIVSDLATVQRDAVRFLENLSGCRLPS